MPSAFRKAPGEVPRWCDRRVAPGGRWGQQKGPGRQGPGDWVVSHPCEGGWGEEGGGWDSVVWLGGGGEGEGGDGCVGAKDRGMVRVRVRQMVWESSMYPPHKKIFKLSLPG